MALTAKKVYAILKRQISNMEAKIKTPIIYRGTVATADLLPLNPDIGDMYNIESKSIYGEAGMNVAWNGVNWDTMGAPIDMSLYIKSSELADWVKQQNKPTYTAEEVGALPADTKIPSKTSDLQNDSGFLTKIPDNYLSGTDKTLSVSGKAADAKATGDKIAELSADISNKLNKNQGSENSGKIAGINESGDIVPMFPVSVDYNEETNCLEFGSDQKMELNKGINLDSTLTKTGYAADAGVVGEVTNSLKEDLVKIKNDYYHEEYSDITSTFAIEIGRYIVAKDTDDPYNGRIDTWSPSAHTNLIPVVEGDKFKISTKTNTNCPCIVFMSGNDFIHSNYIGYTGTLNTILTDEIITIPKGVSYVGFNTADYKNNPIVVSKKYYVPNITDINENITEINTDKFFDERRISLLKKHNQFAWKKTDNKYFIFVIDDTSAFLEPCYDLFHNKQIPLSSASIIEYIDKKWSGTTHTIKELLNLIVADGGEVLMHYSGSLKKTDDEKIWNQKLVGDMLIMRKYGYDVNGLIAAGSTDLNTELGQRICEKYYLYSDLIGVTPEYNMGRRKYLIGVNTIDEMKLWIDECMEENGVYPICIHGNRTQEGDEPLATVENLSIIIDYIKSIGGVCTTYKSIYDKFASSIAEKNKEFVNKFYLNKLYTNLKTTVLNGITCTNNGDGTFTLNGTSTTRTIFNLGNAFKLEKGTYVLSNAQYNDNVNISLCTKNYASGEICATYKNESTLILAEDTIIYPSVNVNGGIVLDNYIITPMLEKGTKAHPFVRYGEPLDVLNYIDLIVN